MKAQNLAPQRTVLYLRVRLQSMRCDIITWMKSSKFSAHWRPRTKKTAQTYATFCVSSFWTRTKLLELHKLATYTFGRVSHVWFPRLQRSRDILLKMQLTWPAAQGFVWRKMRLRRPKVVLPNSKHGTLNPSGPSSFTNVHDVAFWYFEHLELGRSNSSISANWATPKASKQWFLSAKPWSSGS